MNLGFLRELSYKTQTIVVAMEYPGYSFFRNAIRNKQAEPSSSMSASTELIKKHSLIVYDHLKNEIGFREEQIIVFGRSIGSGPASYVASQNKPSALVLVSAFTTIKEVVNSMSFSLLGWLVADHYNNKESVAKSTCPLLLIHGKEDKVIPCSHSSKLDEASITQGLRLHKLKEIPGMDHNNHTFDMNIWPHWKQFLSDQD
mmetsp:Transcript_7443/g.11620  ORF Transcript_7443/g.11620 Transcript_7443/m.11620 type:complete len:201 (+) Transcript_7443:299-901(+)